MLYLSMNFESLLLILATLLIESTGKEDEKALKLINRIITSNGYPVEVHEIETEDGYLLDVHRIPWGKQKRNNSTNEIPVLVTHGLGGDVENFVFLEPNKSLGYMMADQGYDVWLMSARGTWHSKKHKTLDPDEDEAYWNFSWHEIAVYDTPATIDYILNLTNKESLHYIGHSQGTTTLFALTSQRPEYNNKIKAMMALGPAAVNINPRHPIIKLFLPYFKIIQFIAGILNVKKIPSGMSVSTFHSIFHFVCGQRFSPVVICKYLIFLVGGIEHEQFETKLLPLLTKTIPGGSSFKQVVHYAQNIKTGKFAEFDYGKRENLQRYGSKEPPQYNLSRTILPVALFCAQNDLFVSTEAIDFLLKNLPNVVDVYTVPHKEWTHLDFIWARDIDTLQNRKILEIMKKYDGK